MNAVGNLPQDLIKAARSLEERFQILGVPTRRLPQAQWDMLSEDIRAVIPAWVPALLSNYAIAGAWLEFAPLEETSSTGMFQFFWPENYANDLKSGGEY